MLTIFKLPSYTEGEDRPVGDWIARVLFDVVNNNPFAELKDRENSRRFESFDIALREGMTHVREDECPLCGRAKRNYWKLKLEGHTFVVEKSVAETIKEAAKVLFPKLLSGNAAKRNVTEDFLGKLIDISEDNWKKIKETQDADLQANS